MKKIIRTVLALLLVAVMGMEGPSQILAQAAETEYISDIRVAMGGNAVKSLEDDGYIVLAGDDGKPVDVNQGAGGGWASKGEKAVYIGYRTTTVRKDAISDIALMNMKGPYSVEDYDALMEGYLNSQIIPFVENFQAAIAEYRENYDSSYPANKARARYIHDVLNKLTDDDCGGAGLGDLLLNQTKYEMGDAAYDRLSDAEKKQHADIVTIIAQANGVATLAIENLLTRAADTAETTWIQRLTKTTYQDLLVKTGFTLSKAQKEVDKLYYDDAMKILDMWDTFKTQLDNYEETKALLEEELAKDFSEQETLIKNFSFETATDEEIEAYSEALVAVKHHTEVISNATADVVCKEYLETIEYEDGTLLDFFTLPSETVEEDITVIYPVVASLSDGQRAGIEFLTLEDLIMLGGTSEEGYKSAAFDELEQESIYENVDRAVYEPGGVGLTSDAYRSDPKYMAVKQDSPYLSGLTYTMIGLVGASAVALGLSIRTMINSNRAIKALNEAVVTARATFKKAMANYRGLLRQINSEVGYNGVERTLEHYSFAMGKNMDAIAAADAELYTATVNQSKYVSRLQAKSAFTKKLSTGIGVAMVLLVAFTTYMSYRDMVNHYKVEFTPIPRFMVDEKDITGYNARGEKIVIKNQSAYYKAALCNRSSSAEFYDILGNVADLNGDVGKQWLAIYYAKNEAEQPILADSLKVVTGNSQVPADYSTGIHMFGTAAAENLNNSLYVWNSDARSIYVYFRLAEGGANLSGSGFSSGTLAIAGGAGLGLGALVSGLAVNAAGKKKKKAEEAAGETEETQNE